jgi:hypothetical protein
MEIINPNSVILTLEFHAQYIGNAGTGNAFRRALVHKRGEKGALVRPLADEIYNSLLPPEERRSTHVLFPTDFAYIKKPFQVNVWRRVQLKGQVTCNKIISTRQPALGVIMIYEYLGMPEYLDALVEALKTMITRLCQKEKGTFRMGSVPKFFVGKDNEYISP